MKKAVIFLCLVSWGCFHLPALAQESPQILRVMHMSQSGYHPDDVQMLTRVFYDLSGIEVNIDYITYPEQYKKAVEQASSYDIISLDQIWLADLASQNIIVPLEPYISKKVKNDIEPFILKAFQYQGQTWAFPFLINVQLFFYNKTMLEKAGFEKPPSTLEEMLEQMQVLKEEGIVKYPWTDSWQQGEGLISEFVWLTGAFGGKLFDREGQPVFDLEPGVKALEFMVMLLKDQLARPEILSHDEIAAKDSFISGEAAFTSNWIFQTGFLDDSDVSDIVQQGSVGLLPVSEQNDKKTVSVSGFQGIANSAASERKDLAWQWISFFTSPLVQRAFLFEMPIWKSVQTSPDVDMLDPNMALKRSQLRNAYHRPNIKRYAEISSILQRYIHTALEGRMEPIEALKKAKTEIEVLLK
jgi:multiple sugar transport system substrate-binding protein